MYLRRDVLSFAILCLSLPACAATEKNNFLLLQHGKPVGHASYTIDRNKDGSFRVRSNFEYRLSPPSPNAAGEADDAQMSADGDTGGGGGGGRRGGGGGAGALEAQISGEYKVDVNGNFLSGFEQDATTQMMTSFQPGNPREQLTVGKLQGSVNGGTQPLQLPKPDYMLVPLFDPGALQILLTSALAHPHSDNTYLLVVPSASSSRGNPQAQYVMLQPQAEATGTLDGKPVTLQHIRLKFNKGSGDAYLDPDGKLMEADLPMLNASYVRMKFALGK